MEKETKEYTPRKWCMESRPTASRQRIPFVDNRPVNLRFPIQLCKKKFDPQNPYDKSMSEDNILMGREVECGFILLSFKGGYELGNGTTLAKSRNSRSVEVARIELQVEGEIRGTSIIEVIYGPVTGEEYTGFREVRHLLYEVLETASANKLSLDTAIRIFNNQLAKIRRKEYELTLEVAADTVGLMPGHTTNARMIQTNLSLPLAILAATNSDKPMMESLFPSTADSELQLFMKIRFDVTAMYGKLTENVRSLLILVLFQGKQVASTPELTKQLFSVLVKASPADIIFSLLNDEEVDSLLEEKTTAIEEGTSTGLEILAAKLSVKDEKIDGLYQILALRKKHSRMIFAEPVEDYGRAYSVIPETGEHVFHDMPRASGRIYNQLHAGRIVFEIRRKAHKLNDETDDPLTPADYLWGRTSTIRLGAIPTFNIKGLIDRSRDENASNERMLLELEARYAAKREELSHMEDERERTLKEMECVEHKLEEALACREENKELPGLTTRRKEVDALIRASEENMERLRSEQETVERDLSKAKELLRQSQVKTTMKPPLIRAEIERVNMEIKTLERIVARDKQASHPPIKSTLLTRANHLRTLTRPVPQRDAKKTAHQTAAAYPVVIRQAPVEPKTKEIQQQLADARNHLSALEAKLCEVVMAAELNRVQKQTQADACVALTARLRNLMSAIQAEEKKQIKVHKESEDLTLVITRFTDRSREIDQKVRGGGEIKRTLLLRMKQLDDDINELRVNLNNQRVHLETILKKIASDSSQVIPPEYLERHKGICRRLFG